MFYFVGYDPVVSQKFIVNPNKPTILDIKLIESSTSLDVVEITASPFQKSEESPVSKVLMLQKFTGIQVETEIYQR